MKLAEINKLTADAIVQIFADESMVSEITIEAFKKVDTDLQKDALFRLMKKKRKNKPKGRKNTVSKKIDIMDIKF